MEELDLNLPAYKVFTKEITLMGLPRNLAIAVIGCILFSLLALKNLVICLFFIVIYIGLCLTAKFTPKFDPKILEIIGRYCFKRYLDYW